MSILFLNSTGSWLNFPPVWSVGSSSSEASLVEESPSRVWLLSALDIAMSASESESSLVRVADLYAEAIATRDHSRHKWEELLMPRKRLNPKSFAEPVD